MATNTNSVPSISIEIDNKIKNQIHRQHSLQSKSKPPVPIHPIRRHSSLGKNRSTSNIKKPSVSVILEMDKSDDEELPQNNSNSLPVIDSNRISFTKASRKISNISKASKTSVQSQLNSERGFVNYSYDQSTRSSLHGSMSSLPVIREQYCCCSRWTKLERNLALIVAILAIVIIALVIAIGVVAKQGEPNDFGTGYFSVFKF